MKKEIEVKFYLGDLDNAFKGVRLEMPVYAPNKFLQNADVFTVVKATLVVDMPEKKIEITESEFWKAVDECKKDSGIGVMVTPIQLKEKLFGER